jgi:hypothetical protein
VGTHPGPYLNLKLVCRDTWSAEDQQKIIVFMRIGRCVQETSIYGSNRYALNKRTSVLTPPSVSLFALDPDLLQMCVHKSGCLQTLPLGLSV